MKLIDEFMVQKELRILPREKVNKDNMYMDSAGGRCLVGQILGFFGIPLPMFQDSLNSCSIAHPMFVRYLEERGFKFTPNALKLLVVAQRLADKHEPWGKVSDFILDKRNGANVERLNIPNKCPQAS